MHFGETSERALSGETVRGTGSSREYPRLNGKQYNETMLPFGKRKYLREILEPIPRGFLILQTINSKTILIKLYTQFQRDSNNARSFLVGSAEKKRRGPSRDSGFFTPLPKRIPRFLRKHPSERASELPAAAFRENNSLKE